VVAEAFELGDEASGLACGVAVGEVVGAEVAVGLPVLSMCQIALSNVCLTAPRARL